MKLKSYDWGLICSFILLATVIFLIIYDAVFIAIFIYFISIIIEHLFFDKD